MARASSPQDKTVNKVFMWLSVIVAVVLIGIGALAMWAHNFLTDTVRSELAAQKIYFPPKGSPGLDPKEYPDLQQYAGQLVDSPEEAKAYANGFIGRHLKGVADGKVYAEVSSAALKDPTNTTLQQQKQTLFQGETLRGLLLGDGYAFGTIGNVAGYAAYALFAAGGGLVLVALYFRSRM